MSILIVTANFYQDIADMLHQGAIATLDEQGIAHHTITVPGALEIPPAIAMAAESGRYQGYIALGCVIRGETTHYDYVCAESARGLMDLGIKQLLPIGNGILTVESREQAVARASVQQKNKGADVAHACLRLLELQRDFCDA